MKDLPMDRTTDDPGRIEALRRHAVDAVSFQGLESGMRWWHDAASPAGTGAALPYVDVGRSRIAVGTPLGSTAVRARAARRFAADARMAGRRAVFFGVECLDPFEGFRQLAIGLQSELWPSRWTATLRQSAKLREQLRRARAKGVTVRRVAPEELREGAPLRRAVEGLRDEWLASRPMEPMVFLVAVEPFHASGEHLYLVAERAGRAVQFLSAVPIYGRRGWLMEDMLRGRDAPNGTTELVIDGLMREVGDNSSLVTPGLTPLAGAVSCWMRCARAVTAPLYDFTGLQRFRARLSPSRWSPVWLVWDRGGALLTFVDVLRAFAGGRLLDFAARTLVTHPNGPPWAVAVPLVAWTLLLSALAGFGRSDLLGFTGPILWAWVAFDVVLTWLLFRAARRPRLPRLAMMAGVAGFDAVVSWHHLAATGLGAGAIAILLRLLATAGPNIGALALAWAAWRARERRRRS